MTTKKVSAFGKYLKRKRKEHGFTQVKMASILGCHPVHICNIEVGFRQPSSLMVSAVKNYFKSLESK